MPGNQRPSPEDAVTARGALLDGLARDSDIFEVLSRLAPLPSNGSGTGAAQDSVDGDGEETPLGDACA